MARERDDYDDEDRPARHRDRDRDRDDDDDRDRPRRDVPNYLVQSILVTLCCCLPFGIAAIVFAAQVNGKLQSGDYRGAVESSKKAKMFCWIGFGLGIVANGIVGTLQVMAAGAANRGQGFGP